MPAFNENTGFNFVGDSPEFQQAIDFAKRTRSGNKGTVVAGGKYIQDLFRSNNPINSTALDALGGTGQYKLPQRAIAALIGSYALGDENEPLSVVGAGLGYGAGAGLDEAIRAIRDKHLTDAIKGVESNQGLINVDEDYILNQLKAIGDDVKAKDLTSAMDKNLPLDFNLESVPGSSYRTNTPSGYGDVRGFYSGELLDEDVLDNLRGKIKSQIRAIRDVPGYSSKAHLERLNSLLDNIELNRKEFANVGINAKSLRDTGLDKLIKAHELAEMHTMTGLDKERIPMLGGTYNRRGAADIGSLGIIANHTSPAVALREGNLQARVSSLPAQELSKKFQAILGEDKFYNKVLGTSLGDVVLSDKYVAENSDDIARILQKYLSKADIPEQALLDKVRVNPIVSSLGRAGRSIKTFEHGLVNAIKTLIGRRR